MAVPTRAFRQWSAIRDNSIRPLIREPSTVANPYWTDALLLELWNQAHDFRVMQLQLATEGWAEDTFKTDLVQDQANYRLPEGVGRVKAVKLRRDLGDGEQIVPLFRSEQISSTVTNPTANFGDSFNYPTFRLEGKYIILEPTPERGETDGLLIVGEYAPARFTLDTDTLDTRFPDLLETLLVLDVSEAAFQVEAAQGNTDPSILRDNLKLRKYEALWEEYIQDRSQSRALSQGYYTGD